ncbi:MAG: exo-alpha-sialidase [Bacteroidaceae bacterium]|nr:exo-alpha-sialidase [Bacteroidaceae bacterium]
MKRTLLSILACLLTVAAWADGPFRNHRYDSFKVLEPAEGSIVFIGNSITDMHCWHEAFRTSNGDYLPIVNRGNSGTYSTEQSDNIESYLGKKPKKVFMMIGTNDLASTGGLDFTGEQILAYINSIVQRIHLRYPETKIYLYSILNNDTYNRAEERWLHTNELIKTYVSGTGENWLKYIDLYDKLTAVASGGVWSYDKLHLTAAAYQVWCKEICKYLQEGEDYTVECVYPESTSAKQQNGGLSSAHGMRATYFSMLPVYSDDVLVFGDEFIKNGEWQELLGNPNVKNRGTGWGYGGDIATTSKIVDATFASTGVTKESAKAIFLYTGTADANGTTSIATVKTSYSNLVNKIATYSPNSKIYLMALAPTNNASNTTSRIAVLNEYMKSLAGGNIEYIDTYTPLLNGTTANSKYFYPDNYLGAMGYAKFAQIMCEALNADFPGNQYSAISDEAAQTRYEQAGYRNLISQAIGQGYSATLGTSVGEYSAEAMGAFNEEVIAANTLLSSGKITAEQAQQQVERIKTALEKAIVKPKASSDTDEYWYQITSQRSSNLYMTATGNEAGTIGSEATSKSANSMWKLVERNDGSYDIVNRKYKCYLSPSATYNTQIQTTATRPTKGWEIKNSGISGYFIIASGDVQLNQTGSGQNYAIYNWSDPNNKGNDLSDQGCQLKITEAPEPEEEPQGAATIEYTVDKSNGNLYRGTSANQAWNSVWKSNTTPQLQFGCGTINNMNWAGNNVQLMTGTAGSATYTITPPSGYAIVEYSFTFTNNSHSTGLSLTMDNGKVYTTKSTPQTISSKGDKLFSVSFTLAGSNGNGVVLTDFKVKVKEDRLEKPQMSTAGNEHWYYITSASTKGYCSGKAIYYSTDSELLQFGDKAFAANNIWSFWENNGKIAIKNYNGKYFGKAGAGTGGSTKFGTVDTPNYIYTIEDAYGFFIIKDDAVELHAQESGSVIVRWGAEADGASLWRFDEVDTTSPEAIVTSTNVVQGKVSTGIGNKNQPIIRSTIRVSGLTGNCIIQSVKGKFTGTDSKDVENVKAYFATNSRELFIDEENAMEWREQNGLQYGETVEIAADGTFTINGSKELAPGEHYLWITYDISDEATEGNKVDAIITAYTIDGKEIAEENGDPQYQVTIFLSEGAVLMPMDKGSLYYRIPAITVTRDGKRLVTLTDDRKGHNADLPSHCYVVAQYSEDNGRTWSDPQTVAGTATTGGDYGHGDASIVTNRDNGEIVGIMTSAGTYGHGFFAGTAAQPPRWKTITSRDGGLTWETPVDHTDDLYGANCSNPKTKTWKSGFSGSGAALQKRDGTLVSSFVNREADNSQNFYFFMSKDGGKSWYVSGTSGTKSADEPKSLERNNGDLAISVRASGYNYYNYTSNDGETWHLPSQTRFTSGISGNACDGEYMVWCSTLEGNKWNIALQTLPNNSSRQNVSIALSTDEGATFGSPKTICPRGSAYSAAVVLPDGTLGVYYEENGVYGGFTMRFVRFSLDWASNGKYKFTEENPFHPIESTNTNSIELVEESNGGDTGFYDLQGRKVASPTKPGIYINNGRKIVIK